MRVVAPRNEPPGRKTSPGAKQIPVRVLRRTACTACSSQAQLSHSLPFAGSPNSHDDLALGVSLGQVFERFLRLLERKDLVDDGTNAIRFE